MFRELILNTGVLSNLNEATFKLNQTIACYAWRIVSVTLLQNWDATSSTNNVVMFAEAGDTTLKKATLPEGTYDSTTITTALGNALTAAGSQTYTVSYDQTTRRLSVATAGAKTFKIVPASRGSTAFLQLGLDKVNETGYGKNITFPNPLNLSASQPILITSRTLQTNGAIVYASGINSDMNVLAAITPDNFNDVISWVNPSTEFHRSEDTTLNTVDFQIVDSGSLQAIKPSAPVVIVLGIYDDPMDLVV